MGASPNEGLMIGMFVRFRGREERLPFCHRIVGIDPFTKRLTVLQLYPKESRTTNVNPHAVIQVEPDYKETVRWALYQMKN